MSRWITVDTVGYKGLDARLSYTYEDDPISYHFDEEYDNIKEMEEKVAKAEQESKDANQKINDKTQQTKTKIVEKQVVVKQYIDREVTKYDSQCVVPKEFVKAINDAAEPPK